MEFESKSFYFFDNRDVINFFNYLLKKNLPINKITLMPCTKMKNRINIQIILNDYKTVICPVKTDYHWFVVTRQHVLDVNEITGNDVHEFSAEYEDFEKLFNFIWGIKTNINISDTLNEMKKKILTIKKKIESNN